METLHLDVETLHLLALCQLAVRIARPGCTPALTSVSGFVQGWETQPRDRRGGNAFGTSALLQKVR